MSTLNTWQVIEPDNYYKSFIENKSRPDGRDWETVREVSVRVGVINSAEGSAMVQFGNTKVVCGIKAELAVPSLEACDLGFIVPNVELHPCSSLLFKPGPPGEMAIGTNTFLDTLLKKGNIIDLSQLCIEPKKLVWCLYCDIVCLDYDGNLIDASVLALIAALTHLRLPEISYDADTEAVTVSEEHNVALRLQDVPVSTTFGVYSSSVQLLDPSGVDSSECRGEVSIVITNDGAVCCTRKTGASQVDVETMRKFVDVAVNRRSQLILLINNALSHAS